MKIGIISDMHLGHRQYGSIERENDFYDQFLSSVNGMIKEGVELVIIAGDLFDKPNPSPKAMHMYSKGVKELNVPVIAIKGNHTMLMRDNHYSVDKYFFDASIQDYFLLDDESYTIDDIVIQGMYYRADSNLEDLIEKQKELSKEATGAFNILVLHQAFKEYCGFTGAELSIKDIDIKPYDIIISGHIHSHEVGVVDDTIFLQPGSTERMNTTEARDAIENGKGFWILDTDEKSIDFYPLDFSRDFFLGEITFNSPEEINEHFETLEEKLTKMKVLPIISYNYYDNSGNIEKIRDLMKDISKYCLINNSNIHDMVEEEIVIEISENEIPTVFEILKGNENLDDQQSKLANDIHEAYKNGLEDSVEGILTTFFDENIKKEWKESKEIKEMRREIQEYEEFFDNLGEGI